MKSIESEHQIAFFVWVERSVKKYPALEWIHHIPNGGKRSPATAARLKREGVKAGVLDVFLPFPSRGFAGLYIEFKAGKNKLTDNQKAFKAFVEANNFKVVVCYSWLEAKEVVEFYLNK